MNRIKRTSKVFFTLLAVLLININLAQAQKNIKKVSYDIVEYSTMAVKSDVEISSIDDYDLIKSKPNKLIYHVDMTIDSENYLTMTTTYQKMGDDRFGVGYDIAKVVVSKSGVKTYDFKGKERKAKKSLDQKGKPLSKEAIVAFGNYKFVEFDNKMSFSLKEQNKSVFIDKNKMPHIFDNKNNLEIIYDEPNHKYITVKFDKRDKVKRIVSKKYIEIDNLLIPDQIITAKYSKGHSVDELQIKRMKKYISYKIEEKGKVVLDFRVDDYKAYTDTYKKGNSLEKYEEYTKPILHASVSQSNDKLDIDIPVFSQEHLVGLNILDSEGNSMYTISRLNQNSSVTVDISSFETGIYYVNYSNGHESKSVKFVNSKS